MTVPGAASAGTFTLSAPNIAVTQGSSGTSTVSVASQNAYAGTVGFALSTTSTSLQQYGCYTINNATVPSGGSATSTLTLYTSLSACNTLKGSKATGVHSFLSGNNLRIAAPSAPRPGHSRSAPPPLPASSSSASGGCAVTHGC